VEQLFSFGEWVRRRRRALDLTQEELAQQVHCATVTVRKIEADALRPSRQIADRLADSLAIPGENRNIFLQAARAERAVDRLQSPAVLPQAQAPAAAPAATGGPTNLPAAFTASSGANPRWPSWPRWFRSTAW
jgi:transcriptional regulator with XRE-family HTH domain